MRGDLEWGTLPGLLQSAAERFGGASAVEDGDVSLSFNQLYAAARESWAPIRDALEDRDQPDQSGLPASRLIDWSLE